jgi:hypothetical protein
MAADPDVVSLGRTWPPGGRSVATATTAAAAVAVALATGIALGLGLGLYLLVLAGLALGLVAGLANWRRSVCWLLAYLPFAGVTSVLLHPSTAPALLVKDFLFVIPAYAGFLLRRTDAERAAPFGGAAMWLLASFALLVVGQAFNPSLPDGLMGAIGVKVWLFYIPLALLGYHLVTDRHDLHRVLGLISLAAVVPALIGIGEALLIYSGRASLVYGLYGDAAASVTQDFAEFSLAGGAVLRRVPSTFAFVAQYFAFTVAMAAVTYAWWRGAPSRRWSGLRAGIWLLLLLAGFLSGARAAFLFIPFLMALILMLEGRTARFAFLRLAAPAALFLGLTVAVLGTTAGSVLGHALETGAEEFGFVFVDGFRQALDTTRAGLGTGIDTNAARHAFGQTEPFTGVGGTWYESWYVKAHLELGVAGLVILALLLGVLTTRALRQHRRLRDPQLKVVSASLIGLLLWNLIFNVKAQYLDIDPMNVYFWLLLGLLLKLPALDPAEPPTASPSDDER